EARRREGGAETGGAVSVGDDDAVERGEHEDVGVHTPAMILQHRGGRGVIGGGRRRLQREVTGEQPGRRLELAGAVVELPGVERARELQLLLDVLAGARTHERCDRDVGGHLDQREETEEHDDQTAAEPPKMHRRYRPGATWSRSADV